MLKQGYLCQVSSNPVAIIDIGSGLIKSGLEGTGNKTGYTGPVLGETTPEGTPSHILHNAVTPSQARSNRKSSCVCCDLALTHAHAAGKSWDYSVAPVQVDQPVTRGKVRDYGQLENVLYHVLHHELECHVATTPLIITGKFLSTLNEVDVAPLAQIAFEKLGHPSMAFCPPAPLILMSTGRLDGAVVDIGHGACSTAAVLGGRTVPGSVCRVPLGGIDVTRELQTTVLTKLAGLDGQTKTAAGDKIATNWTWRRTQVWEELKKKFAKFSPQRGHTEGLWALRDNVVARRHAYLASTSFACKGLKKLSSRHRVGLLRYMLHFDRGMKMPSGVQPIMWELPDGTQLRLGSELSECTEILWRSAPDYIEGGDRQASWRQQRTAQTKRTPLSMEQRRSTSSVLGKTNMSRIPKSDLPRGNKTNKSNNGIIVPMIGEEEQEALDPRIAKDCSDLAGALLETYHQCADHGITGQKIRRNVIKNTIYAGGTTLHPGFQSRAIYELQSVAGDEAKHLTFWSAEQPLYAAYKGASLLANSTFRDSAAMITKEEYEEQGCGMIVDRWAF